MMKGFVQKVLPLDTLGAHLISQYGSDRSGSDKQDGSEKSDRVKKFQFQLRGPDGAPE